jgi:hypothetical protein
MKQLITVVLATSSLVTASAQAQEGGWAGTPVFSAPGGSGAAASVTPDRTILNVAFVNLTAALSLRRPRALQHANIDTTVVTSTRSITSLIP